MAKQALSLVLVSKANGRLGSGVYSPIIPFLYLSKLNIFLNHTTIIAHSTVESATLKRKEKFCF